MAGVQASVVGRPGEFVATPAWACGVSSRVSPARVNVSGPEARGWTAGTGPDAVSVSPPLAGSVADGQVSPVQFAVAWLLPWATATDRRAVIPPRVAAWSLARLAIRAGGRWIVSWAAAGWTGWPDVIRTGTVAATVTGTHTFPHDSRHV